ncbi:succinylglutamate desuccinylase/aspartoacylase family protein [Maribacter flavus]|uniref:Succinylglutamate desuccinylase n=1 Tax=Maribacter flavus TaxID=1658664 RepID=A0A5B2TX15_9FLAO|nr:succinylglutamate desuccinylase/aspartoacylase family protein [Maribacter flavus]KAA2218683.1 succinylglutamate desuccinylase [Maribacter flavus]
MRLFTICLLLLTAVGPTRGQEGFLFQKTKIAPGTKKHFRIPVTDGRDSTFIPVTVIHGLKSGPVLGVTAGVHGYEYPPILAAQQINKNLDPSTLKGTVILVQAANVPGFFGRSPNLNPLDDKNLNRVFPGSPTGSITERMAYTITEEVISKSDFFVDVHGGDSPEDLMPYNAWYDSPAFPETSNMGREMAMAMGFDFTVMFNVSEERVLQPSLYCSQEAFHRQIPAVDIECGRLGIPGIDERDRIVSALYSLMAHLKMLPEKKVIKKKPTIISKRATITSDHDGIFYSDKKAGDRIAKGEKVGYITNFFGEKLEEIIADDSGIVLYIVGTPPINKGETLVSLGILD